MFAILMVAVMAVASSVVSTSALSKEPLQKKSDPISGQWKGSFETQDGGTSFAITLDLKLDGERVTGTSESPVGSGTVTGSWKAGELNVAIETDHGTLAMTGALKDGLLFGQWDAGHAQGKWEARKK
jgi:hypothetical protein